MIIGGQCLPDGKTTFTANWRFLLSNFSNFTFFKNLNVKKRQLPVKKRQLLMKKMGNWRFLTFKRQFVVKLEKLDNAKYTLKLSVY